MQQAAETILDRKFNEGEAKGRIEGTRDMLRSLLIAKPSFRVTDEVETRLQSASLEDLQQWATRLFLGESVDDVLGL